MQKITTYLWFENQAEEAANFYVSLFKNSKINSITRCGEAGPGPAGSALIVVFELAGQQFYALNGGPKFKFNEAISLLVDCESQAEVDELWDKLTADDGQPSRCAWLKDKFGLSWQIVPAILGKLMSDPDPVKAQCVMMAMLQMDKIDIQKLQDAYDGK